MVPVSLTNPQLVHLLTSCSCCVRGTSAFLGGVCTSPFPATLRVSLRRSILPSPSPPSQPSPLRTCRALACDAPRSAYEFRDDTAHVELRLLLPEGKKPVSASSVFVDAQDTSLSVTLASPAGLLNLLPATRLYSRIKASDTVWFVDEEEIVISLQKLDKEISWPGLSEDWEALTVGVCNLLKGVSVYIVGESTEINWAVAKALAEGLDYVPLQTSQLLEQAANKPLERVLADEKVDDVADAEAMILGTLNAHVRLVVGTLGGNHGAASRKGKWSNLHAGFTIWLSQSHATDDASAEEEAKSAKKDGHTAYANAEVVVALSGWRDDSARPAAEGCLRALKYLLESEKDLPGKKNLYVRLGCRGDWPNIMPPGWDPSGGEGKTARSVAL